MRIGRIYKIISTQGNECYIGSTFNTTRDRFKNHKTHYEEWKKGKRDNMSVFQLFDKYGIQNCKIVLIKEYYVVDRYHLEVYETLWIYKSNSNCINKYIPFNIKRLYKKQYNQQYQEKNRKKLKQQYQQYYQNNKDKRQQYLQNNKEKLEKYRKLYWEQNKEKIQQYRENRKEQIKQNRQKRYQNEKNKLQEKFDCKCGGKYTFQNKLIHTKTQKHQKWLERQNQN